MRDPTETSPSFAAGHGGSVSQLSSLDAQPFSSIRWRIQAWHALLLTLVTASLLTFVYLHEKIGRVERVDLELTSDLVALMPRYVPLPHGRPVPRPEGLSAGEDPGFRAHFQASGDYVVVFRADGSVSHRSPGAPAGVPPPDARRRGNVVRWNGANREVAHSAPSGVCLVVGQPGGILQHALHALAWKLAALGVAIVALGVTVGSWLVGVALRPLRDIGQTARQIADGDWKRRILPTGGASELGALAAVLNESFARIEKNYEQQKRFSADAAHELGNPVSIVLSQTQHALGRPRDAADYVNALEACRRAGERMRIMTRDLLDLEGYESGRATAHRIGCDLAEIVREAREAVSPLAEERRAAIVEDLHSVKARVHAGSLGHAFVNLLANAIRHNADGVRVTVRLRAENGWARLDVADDGRGIPARALPYLFDRFYRVDPDAPEGRGLGLAITKAIVVAHGGSVAVESEPGHGAHFTVRLPCAQAVGGV